MGRPRTTKIKCPFCSQVVFVLDENGCIEDDCLDSGGCRHYAGTIDEDYMDGPQPGFEAVVEAYRLWQRVQEEGWSEAEVRAAFAGKSDALALVGRLKFTGYETPQKWSRRIPGLKCRRRAWDGGGMPGHNGIANYLFVEEGWRWPALPALEALCEALRGLLPDCG